MNGQAGGRTGRALHRQGLAQALPHANALERNTMDEGCMNGATSGRDGERGGCVRMFSGRKQKPLYREVAC